MPSKRTSVLNRSPGCNDELDSSTDDESIPEETISPDKEYNYPRDHISNSILPPEPIIKPPIRESSMGSQQHSRPDVKQNQLPNQKYTSSNSAPERRPPQNLPPLVSNCCYVFYLLWCCLLEPGNSCPQMANLSCLCVKFKECCLIEDFILFSQHRTP